jgi:PleD family two-component response regulator
MHRFPLNQVPIIMLSARGDQRDRVAGLENGANDYLVKPYSNEELLLRVKNVLEWNIRQKEANPLTGLPGNTAIEREMIVRISQKKQYAFLYIDIDNFKGFNDTAATGATNDRCCPRSRTIERLGKKDDFVTLRRLRDGRPTRGDQAQHVVDESDKAGCPVNE